MADVGGMTDAELFAVVVEEARRKGVVVADPTPPASRTCVVNGLRLHLLDWQGEGRPPMLLLHGALLNAHVWDDFSLDMRQHFHIHAWLHALPNVRLIVVPETGHNVMSVDPLAFRRAVGDFLSSPLKPLR